MDIHRIFMAIAVAKEVTSPIYLSTLKFRDFPWTIRSVLPFSRPDDYGKENGEGVIGVFMESLDSFPLPRMLVYVGKKKKKKKLLRVKTFVNKLFINTPWIIYSLTSLQCT